MEEMSTVAAIAASWQSSYHVTARKVNGHIRLGGQMGAQANCEPLHCRTSVCICVEAREFATVEGARLVGNSQRQIHRTYIDVRRYEQMVVIDVWARS